MKSETLNHNNDRSDLARTQSVLEKAEEGSKTEAIHVVDFREIRDDEEEPASVLSKWKEHKALLKFEKRLMINEHLVSMKKQRISYPHCYSILESKVPYKGKSAKRFIFSKFFSFESHIEIVRT